MQLFNLTPYAAERVLTASQEGRDTLLVVVKATFSLAALDRGVPQVAEAQAPVTLVDEYAGEPGQSSLLRPTDLVPEKPGAELLLTGALRLHRAGESVADVAIQLGGVSKQLRVFGDRVWEKALFGYRSSPPQPLHALPIAWERAYGGVDESTQERFEANPIGCGFAGKKSRAKLVGAPVPNYVDPRAPVDAPTDTGRAVGLGALAPAWKDRRQHAGTYDQAWQDEVSPFLPHDFDPRYFLAAPRDQRLPQPIAGGERARITGLAPTGQLDFELPRVRLELEAMMGGTLEALPAACDTVLVDLDAATIMLTWRGRLDVHERLDEIRWIRAAIAPAEARR